LTTDRREVQLSRKTIYGNWICSNSHPSLISFIQI